MTNVSQVISKKVIQNNIRDKVFLNTCIHQHAFFESCYLFLILTLISNNIFTKKSRGLSPVNYRFQSSNYFFI